MNVLMIGNIASVGWNLTVGLRKNGINVTFIGNESKITSGEYDYRLSWSDLFQKKYGKKYFDIVHIHSPNFKKFGVSWRYLTGLLFFFDSKIICHWHGSDLRMPHKAFPVYHLFKKIADYHLYSTVDLSQWLKDIPENKKMHFRNPVDINLFKPNGNKKIGILISGRGVTPSNKFISHNKIPEMLNKYEMVKVYPANNLDPHLISVSALESASCGCKLYFHPNIDRQWIINNASIKSQTNKLVDIYDKILQ